MSLIESALERLRRGDAGSDRRAPAPRAVAAVTETKTLADFAPAPEPPHKHISVDLAALRKAGYLPEEGLERRFADQYRQIKRPLIERAINGGAEMRLILVSSALPGDGKTFTSINLALSMAREQDISVLLVDADAPKRHISQVFGLRQEPGLIDALVDDSLDVESLIVHTDIRGLEILPSGRFVENATELLASTRMEQIANRVNARGSRRLVLLDSAPLLVSSEARVLLRIPGQVVLVVRVDVTPRQAMLDAVALVDKKKLQGVVLNQATFTNATSYYGYPGYGEGDGTSGPG